MKSLLPTFLLASLVFAAAPAEAKDRPHALSSAPASAGPALQSALRGLWQGHVTHTRDYALAVHAGDPGRAARAEAAVVANAKRISAAIGGFYGAPASARQLELLAAHWKGVKALTEAARRNDRVAETAAFAALTSNARDIALFLSGANPYLPLDAVNGMLVAHGGHHSAQIDAVMRDDRKAEADATRAMRVHMDAVADAMAAALVRQFPEKLD